MTSLKLGACYIALFSAIYCCVLLGWQAFLLFISFVILKGIDFAGAGKRRLFVASFRTFNVANLNVSYACVYCVVEFC